MGEFDISSAMVRDAIRELRSLALVSLARAMGERAEFPADMPGLTAVLTSGGQAPPRVQRREHLVNCAMPFALFEPQSALQHRVLASGKAPGFVERLLTRFRRVPAQIPPDWVDATVATALTAPAFLAEAQRVAYRGLRNRVFFAPGGPPLQPISVATFLALIVSSGQKNALSPQVWGRIEALARQAADQPGWPGPTDRLVLAETRITVGKTAADTTERAKGIEHVSG